MTDTSENNKRIAKNTLLLYVRMILMMIISLYTSRVVLNTLGVEDYGIYNVVGGVVSMFVFINASMTSVTQRYINYALGKGNSFELKQIFVTSLIIHFVIAGIIFILCETIGLWFLQNKMIIPEDRIYAANWVFQCVVFSTMIMIISVPYNATIIAHEKMSAFAYISIFEAVFKLLIVFLISVINYDKLIYYSLLLLLVQIIIRFIYQLYSRKHFPEVRFSIKKDLKLLEKKLFSGMCSFAVWNIIGNLAVVGVSQGINILLNIFWGPLLNAAKGISTQVQGTINGFASNFQLSINPQITKSYASNNLHYMYQLVYSSSKYSFFVLFIISLPVLIECNQILFWWLGQVPDYTIFFVRIILIISMIDSMSNSLIASIQASGKIRLYQFVVGITILTVVPISYIVTKYIYKDPHWVMGIYFCINLIALVIRLVIVHKKINLSLKKYFVEVILKVILVVLISSFIPVILYLYMSPSLYRFLLVCGLSVVNTLFAIYLCGLNNEERYFIKSRINKIINRL